MYRVIDADGVVVWTGDDAYIADGRARDIADAREIPMSLERFDPSDPHANDGWVHDSTIHPVPE